MIKTKRFISFKGTPEFNAYMKSLLFAFKRDVLLFENTPIYTPVPPIVTTTTSESKANPYVEIMKIKSEFWILILALAPTSK